MAWKDIIGVRFSPAEFDDYVRQLVFSAWRPQFVVVHHTGFPALADRPQGFTAAHMQNMVHDYRDTQGWDSGPHCFVDQNGIWVFTPLTTSGTHSPSWNEISWGVETLGDYDADAFTDPVHEHLVACLATLHSVAPLDPNTIRFHREDPNTTHHRCPGQNINKAILVQDVHALLAARQTLASPASGRYSGRTDATVAPQSHFFADQAALAQTDAIAYGPLSTDRQNKFRLTSLVTSTAASVKAYAAVTGMVMIQRVNDPANPGSYLANVVNLVLKPFKQPINGFTPVKYFIYRNLRLDSFLVATDDTLVRAKAGGSEFIQNLWTIHTKQNGTAPFQSTALGFDPANQTDAAEIDTWFHRQNVSQQPPFAARGEVIGQFYKTSATDTFGLEIILEGDFHPDYAYVRTSTEAVVDAATQPRARVLSSVDPAAFYGMHMASDGWLEVQDGAAKKKLKGADVYDKVVKNFATCNTLYIDVRNENGLDLDFYGAYAGTSGNAIEVGTDAAALTAQPYATDQWPLLIRKSVAAPNTNHYDLVYLRFHRDYNHKPILYLQHGEPDAKTTRGRFIAGDDLIASADTNTKAIGFRFPNADAGGGQRIGVAWLIQADYTLRQDPANIPFPAKVVPTVSYLDNLFGPVDADLPWTVNHAVIAWARREDRKYVDGDGVAALGFEHVADRGVAFSAWTGAASTAGTVLFYAAAKDVFVNSSNFVPQNGIASGVSNRDTIFAEPMLFNGYAAGYDAITDGPDVITTLTLREVPPHPRPPEAMLLLGLSRAEVDTQLRTLTGLDVRHARNVLLQEVAGSPFTDPHGTTYRKYKTGLQGIKSNGDAQQLFPATDVFVYTIDRKLFFSKAFSVATPAPAPQPRNAEEAHGLEPRDHGYFDITAASGATLTLEQPAKTAPTEPDVDFTREIVPGDKVSVDSEPERTVVSVAMSGNEGLITIDLPVAPTVTFPNTLYCAKYAEDYFIDKDLLPASSSNPSMRQLVDQFVAAVNAVPNDGSAPAAIRTHILAFGPKILDRARLICRDSAFAYADDRILYWARIRMAVAFKNHDFLKKNWDKRNELIELFEQKTRGFDSVTFSGAGGRRKVLVTGFDPFDIPVNQAQGNPSGAVALALHGGDFPNTAPTIHVQSAMFPVRYADFGDLAGVVESFFERFINPAHPDYDALEQPDLIVTLSQTPEFAMLLERFAGRARQQVRGDNLDPNKPIQLMRDVNGIGEFYETTLDPVKMVPADSLSGKFKLHYNNDFEYEWGRTNFRYSEPSPRHDGPSEPTAPAFVTDAPSNISASKKSKIIAIKGSGGFFLSNEIFYRVARLRSKFNPAMKTGHLHLPAVQARSRTVSLADATVGSAKALQFDVLKSLIEEVANALVRAFL